MIGLQYQAEIPPYLGEYAGEERGKGASVSMVGQAAS